MVAKAIVINAEDRFLTGDETMPPMDLEEGSSFGYFERLFLGFRDGKVFDYGDWQARDIYQMFEKYYKATQLEQVLSGPIESAETTVRPAKNDRGEAELWQAFAQADEFAGGMDTPQDLILSQMTSAYSYRKAYFEKVWTPGTGDFAGKVVYKRIAFRPATTCRTARLPNGTLVGFEQDPWYLGQVSHDIDHTEMIEIPMNRALLYVHGQRRDPVNGVSDMAIPYWCYKTMQKVLFLWLQFAEQASLPRTVVKAQDLGTAQQVARTMAGLRNSGVAPVATPQGPQSVEVQTLDISGKGGEQFQGIITWLDQAAVNSAGAGFLNLTDQAKSGGGWALSADASDFYLQRLNAKAKEQAREYRRQVIAPFIRYNAERGPEASVPLFTYEPLNVEDITPQVTMLDGLLRSRDPALVPEVLIEEVAVLVSERWGLDVAKVRAGFKESAAKAQAAAAQLGAKLPGQQVAGAAAAVDSIGRAAKQAATQ